MEFGVAAQQKTDSRCLSFIVRLSALAMLCTVVLAWRLYAPGFRVFAPAPIIVSLAALPDAVNWVVLAACIACLLWLLAMPQKRLPAVGVLACSVFWVLQDFNRLPPYNYMYYYAIFIAAWCGKQKAVGLNALKVMIGGVYFWAGFHKLNATFYLSVFPWFIEPLHVFPHSLTGQPSLLDTLFAFALLITPFFELSIGILLFFPKRRCLATGMAFVMLMVVLFCLGPLGHNWGMAVWPWNIYLFLMEYTLFFSPVQGAAKVQRGLPVLLSIALFVVAPVLAMVTPWYALTGFKLYSGNAVTAEIVLPERETLAKAPAYVRMLVSPKHRLDLAEWTVREIGDFYPVPYVVKMGVRGLCPYLDYPADAKLIISFPPPFYSVERSEQELPVCPSPLPNDYR